jgi:hypothetical protein
VLSVAGNILSPFISASRLRLDDDKALSQLPAPGRAGGGVGKLKEEETLDTPPSNTKFGMLASRGQCFPALSIFTKEGDVRGLKSGRIPSSSSFPSPLCFFAEFELSSSYSFRLATEAPDNGVVHTLSTLPFSGVTVSFLGVGNPDAMLHETEARRLAVRERRNVVNNEDAELLRREMAILAAGDSKDGRLGECVARKTLDGENTFNARALERSSTKYYNTYFNNGDNLSQDSICTR